MLGIDLNIQGMCVPCMGGFVRCCKYTYDLLLSLVMCTAKAAGQADRAISQQGSRNRFWTQRVFRDNLYMLPVAKLCLLPGEAPSTQHR